MKRSDLPALFATAGRGILLSLLLITQLSASTPRLDGGSWTLDELLALGRSSNLDLQSSQLAVEGLKWDKLAAYGALMPVIQLSSSYGTSRSRIFNYEFPDGSILDATVESKSTASTTGISLRQPLFEGFARTAAFKKARIEEERVIQSDERQHQLFEHDLRLSAHAVLAANDRLGTEKELLAQKETQLELATLRLSVGTGTELDRLQSELELGRQRVQIESAELSLQSAWDQLALLIGVESGSPGDLQLDFSVFKPTWTEEQLVEMALAERRDLLRAEAADQQAKLDVIQSRSAFLPTLSLDMYHNRDSREDGYAAWDPDQRNYTNSAQLSLAMPIFQGFSNLNNYKRSQSALRRQELATQQQRLQIRAEIREALQQLISAWKQSQLTAANVDLASKSLRLERERFKQGLSSLLHLKDAEAVWRQAKNEDLAQRLQFHDRLADLQLAVGSGKFVF